MASENRFIYSLSCGSIFVVLLYPINAHAVVNIDSGQTVTVPGTHASPWNVGDDLYVG
ncbi:hypothetical protein [Yersinia alsatica]|uniref:hypothetical protein n=1 Tax=Yersinia alsatica TaxID=2890317 RepID=UPI001643D0BE|nr:hypothetical protein [Yersinia alsatica]